MSADHKYIRRRLARRVFEDVHVLHTPSLRLTRISASSTRTRFASSASRERRRVGIAALYIRSLRNAARGDRTPFGTRVAERSTSSYFYIYASVFSVIHQRRRALVAPPPPATPKPRSTASKRDPLVTRPARTPAPARPARPASRSIALRACALAQIPAPRKPPAPRAVPPRA